MRASALVLCALAACTPPAGGDPAVDRTDIAFGRVRVGDTGRVEATLRNAGAGPLRIDAIERAGLPASFTLAPPPAEIAPGASAPLRFAFAPTEAGAVAGTLALSFASPRERIEFALSGEGVVRDVSIFPEALSFGPVELGDRATLAVTLENRGLLPEQVEIVSLPRSEDFRLAASAGSVFPLAPGESTRLSVEFQPARADADPVAATLELRACPDCAPTTIALTGIGLDSYLGVEPAGCLDFGEINPGATASRTVTVANRGPRALQVQSSRLDGSTDFSLEGPVAGAIPAGGSLALAVVFRPGGLGRQGATLRIATDDPRARERSVCLEGAGGGPDVEVSPAALAVGTAAVGMTRTRALVVVNRAIPGAASEPLVVRAARFPDGAGAFSVPLPSPLSIPAGSSARLSVLFTPTAAGTHSTALELDTNDLDTPVVRVPLAGSARALAPCRLEIAPAALSFGNLEPGRRAVLPVSLRNLGTEDCIAEDLRLAPAGDEAFSLVEGAVPELVVAPGATHRAPVAFEPKAPGARTGALLLRVSDPAAPGREVALSGLSAKGCLMLAPDALDFGPTTVGCSSGARPLALHNTCAATVTVEAITVAPGTGAAFVIGAPSRSLPAALAAEPLRFSATFTPAAAGEDVGGITVKTAERAEPYLLPVSGRGLAAPPAREAFVQTSTPVDLLLVVDNSGGLCDDQHALADNLESLLRYSREGNIDFRIAVTTTDTDQQGAAKGRFLPLSGPGARVLTRGTPQLAYEFEQRVVQGCLGSATERGFEPAWLALQPDLLAGHNAGFLREEARLSVLVLADEEDQSSRDPDFYASFFRNLKGALHPERFVFSAMCDLTEPPHFGVYGARYIQLAQETGGAVMPLDADDWPAEVERVGAAVFGPRRRFFLRSAPAAGQPVRVLVDGTEVPPVQGLRVQWALDRERAIVDFDPLVVPDAGSVVEVEYVPACGP